MGKKHPDISKNSALISPERVWWCKCHVKYHGGPGCMVVLECLDHEKQRGGFWKVLYLALPSVFVLVSRNELHNNKGLQKD